MSFGKMNGFAEIKAVKKEKDSEGFATQVEVTLASVRVYREGRHGSERWANLAAFSEATDPLGWREQREAGEHYRVRQTRPASKTFPEARQERIQERGGRRHAGGI